MGVVGVGCGGVVLLSAAGSVCGAGRWLFLSLVRVPVWRVCGGVGVVVDCLIARVDDDVRPALWGRAGLAFCFLWGLGCFFGPVVGLSAFFVESLILAQDERWRRA